MTTAISTSMTISKPPDYGHHNLKVEPVTHTWAERCREAVSVASFPTRPPRVLGRLQSAGKQEPQTTELPRVGVCECSRGGLGAEAGQSGRKGFLRGWKATNLDLKCQVQREGNQRTWEESFSFPQVAACGYKTQAGPCTGSFIHKHQGLLTSRL